MLNLNQTQLNKECIQFLSKALRRHSQLVFLDIGFNNLKDDGLEPLLAALEVIKRPFDLRVAGNLLTDKIANHIIMLLTNNRIVFSHLTIDNNPQISKSKIVEIQELIKMKYAPYSSKFLTKGKISPAMPTSSVSPKKLTSLDFSDNESFGQQLSLITATLEQNPSVKELNLSGNGWGDKENMQILIKGLARSQIVIFDFSKNNLGPEGAELLAEWLKENKSLKELNLSHNQLGAEGTNILVKSLSKHPTLKKLNLDDNALEDKGTETLATNLLHHPSLEYLSLQNNKIRERGARALLSFLKNKSKNSLLYEIKISKDLFIPNLYYQTLQIAIRFWCYLPSQDRLLRLHLDENGKYMILIDSEASLLEKIIKFLQEIMTFSEEKSKEACSNYPKYIEHCKKELEENAHNVLKERGVALIAEKEITAQIAGICAMYEDVHIKSLDISKLMVRLQELKEVYNNYMEENAQYIEQLSQIKEELLDIEVWKLLLDPAPNPDHENIDSHTGVSLLTSPFTLMGNSSAMASSSSTSSERTGETLSK